MIAVRVDSCEQKHLDGILSLSASCPLFGVEIMLSAGKDFPSSNIFKLLDLPDSKKLMCLNYRDYAGEMLVGGLGGAAYRAFLRDINLSHRLGVSNAVLHWSNSGCHQTPSKREAFLALSMFEEKEVLPHIKNLAVSYERNRDLVESMIESGCPFGVCFSLGHAARWGGASFDKWFLWLKDIDRHGISLVFHLHDTDDHDSRQPIWCRDHCDCGGFAPGGLISVIRLLLNEFPLAAFVVEAKDSLAVQSLNSFHCLLSSEIGQMRHAQSQS